MGGQAETAKSQPSMSKYANMKAEKEKDADSLDFPPPNELSLDGIAFSTAQANEKALQSKEVGDLTIQISDLKRKIERQESEIRENRTEIRSRDKELRVKDQALKQARVEIETLMSDKESLAQKLKVAESKSFSQLAEKPDKTKRKMDANRIRELEDTVLMTKHKFIKLEESVEHEKARYSELEVDCAMHKEKAEEVEGKLKEVTSQFDAVEPKLRNLDELVKTKDESILGYKQEIDQYREKEVTLRTKIEDLEKAVSDANNKAAEQLKKLNDFKDEVNNRNLEGAIVKAKDEALLENEVVIGESELKRLRIVDLAYQKSSIRMEGLVKSVETHMELLKKSEATSSRLTKIENERLRKISLLERTIAVHDQEKARIEAAAKRAKGEAARLKSDLKEALEQLAEYNKNGQQDMLSKMRDGMATMAKSKQEEAEGKLSERRLRRAAEESSRAMKNRISFLLEQMGQASGFDLSFLCFFLFSLSSSCIFHGNAITIDLYLSRPCNFMAGAEDYIKSRNW